MDRCKKVTSFSSGIFSLQEPCFQSIFPLYWFSDSNGIRWKSAVRYLCTVRIGRAELPGVSHRLDSMCAMYEIPLDHHRADSDSHACAEILLRYMRDLTQQKIAVVLGMTQVQVSRMEKKARLLLQSALQE